MESINKALREASALRVRARALLLYAALTATALQPISAVEAQTFSEFFKQSKTQRKYLIEQIAALTAYAGYARQGYDIARNGLGAISDFTNGEFGLHGAFFASLKAVSPLIRNHGKIPEIVSMQLAVAKDLNGMAAADLLPGERDYISAVRQNLLAECAKDLDGLLTLVTDGSVGMTDAQRLAGLEAIHARMADKLLVMQWTGQVKAALAIRSSERRSLTWIRRLYGNE